MAELQIFAGNRSSLVTVKRAGFSTLRKYGGEYYSDTTNLSN